jgi:hypothetical protein
LSRPTHSPRHLDERLLVENHSTSRAATALPNAPLCRMNFDPINMLVKLSDLPKSCAVFERVGEQGIHIRRALAAEKHKIAAWLRENFAEGWASETEIAFGRPAHLLLHRGQGR